MRRILSITMVAMLASPAFAGRQTRAITRQLARVPIVKRLVAKPNPMVLGVSKPEMELEVPNAPVWAAFGKNDAKGAANAISIALGRRIAKGGFLLATGGGEGLPKRTEDGAYFAGGFTIAFSPKGDLESHAEGHKGNIFQTTHLVPTGTGSGAGTISREAPMAQAANYGVGSFANGGPGTFGELVAMMHNDAAVLAFMKGTGGVADAAPGWLGWMGVKPTFKVLSESDPAELTAKASRALATIARPMSVGATRTLRLVSPGKGPKEVLNDADKADRSVGAFLTVDPRESAVDHAETERLMRAWNEYGARAKAGATFVMPEEATAPFATSLEDSRTVVVSPRAGGADRAKGARRVALGFGDVEMGGFAAGREITKDAEVVFFSSAHYRNLGALAYALRAKHQPVIAVLTNESTHADKLPGMIDVIEPEAKDRVVYASDAKSLMQKVAAKLQAKREKSFDDKRGLD